MMSSLDEDVERLRELAERQDPAADRAEYDTVWQRALDTANKIRESRGVYLPDISSPNLRQRWQQSRAVANSAISWLLQNKGPYGRNNDRALTVYF
jgi:glutaminase